MFGRPRDPDLPITQSNPPPSRFPLPPKPSMLSKSLTSGSFKDLSRIEQSFMQDFTCCGLVLRDLHELVQHWEEHQGQVDAGMETDMTLEDEDGWDDETRTQPDENEGDAQDGMMMGEMDMAR